MCYLAELTGSQNSCQLNMRRILSVRNYAYSISTILLILHLCLYIYLTTRINVCL